MSPPNSDRSGHELHQSPTVSCLQVPADGVRRPREVGKPEEELGRVGRGHDGADPQPDTERAVEHDLAGRRSRATRRSAYVEGPVGEAGMGLEIGDDGVDLVDGRLDQDGRTHLPRVPHRGGSAKHA